MGNINCRERRKKRNENSSTLNVQHKVNQGNGAQNSEGMLTIQGLRYEKLSGNGHCLFNAVALYINQDPQQLRSWVVECIRKDVELQSFLTLVQEETIDQYLQKFIAGQEWADHIEIEVLMRLLDRPVIVIDKKDNIRNIHQYRGSGDPIFVYYKGRNHYDALLLTLGYEERGGEIFDRLIQLREYPSKFTYAAASTDENGRYISPQFAYKLIDSSELYYGLSFKELEDYKFDWKIHISLQEQVANVTKAWDVIIFPAFIKYQIKEAKVIRSNKLRENSDGKVVTIYLAYNPELKFGQPGHYKLAQFLQEIEDGLVTEKIILGPPIEFEEKISGSQYLHYRCEKKLKLKLAKVLGKGHCLFEAVGRSMNWQPQNLRNLIADRVEIDLELQSLLPLVSGKSIEHYLQRLRAGEEWEDHIEMAVLMMLLDRPIIVVGPDGYIKNMGQYSGSGEPVFVSYNDDHYDALLLTYGYENKGKEILKQFIQGYSLEDLCDYLDEEDIQSMVQAGQITSGSNPYSCPDEYNLGAIHFHSVPYLIEGFDNVSVSQSP